MMTLVHEVHPWVNTVFFLYIDNIAVVPDLSPPPIYIQAVALEEDIKYSKTDEMKKRAIRTAKNYDEFKNLVACANLKPVR